MSNLPPPPPSHPTITNFRRPLRSPAWATYRMSWELHGIHRPKTVQIYTMCPHPLGVPTRQPLSVSFAGAFPRMRSPTVRLLHSVDMRPLSLVIVVHPRSQFCRSSHFPTPQTVFPRRVIGRSARCCLFLLWRRCRFRPPAPYSAISFFPARFLRMTPIREDRRHMFF